MRAVKKITILLSMMSLFAIQLQAQTGDVNSALEATIATSYVSPWETLEAVNDDEYGTSSSFKPLEGIYGNWNALGNYNWVEYSWPGNILVESTSVFWFTDFGGILLPTDAYVEYWNGVDWINAGNIGKAGDKFNSLSIGVWTSKIRINMKSTESTGIVEWQVWSSSSKPCEVSDITVTMQVNDQEAYEGKNVVATTGDNITLKIETEDTGDWQWSGPEGFTATANTLTIENAKVEQSGSYDFGFRSACGGDTSSFVNITVLENEAGAEYTWPAYTPDINYDFRDEFPALSEPTEDLLDVEALGEVGGRISDGWWTFAWGPEKRSVITEDAIYPMLERFNQDFAYFRDVMGWPPDKRAKNGYRSAIYLYGSGLATDDADTNALGGWQGAVSYQGQSWPNVLASYYPVFAFDPNCPDADRYASMGAMIHEGIHALLADLPGARNSAWFHEGGNTWLQQEMESQKSGDFSSMGFLNAGAMIAPFMPIECYSGWLQDGSFGGPSAEGVNMFEGSQQICTWKNILGGNQYGNMFPVVLSQVLGKKSIPWIWRYCENRVLEGIGDTLGDYQMRRLISEYRAHQAVLDIGEWTGATRKLLDANFGIPIQAEWQPSWLNPAPWTATPYVRTEIDGQGWIIPESRTTPGWSGANQIPLKVEGDTAVIYFQPESPNMTCQLCYRASDGTIVYGQRVFGGECTLALDKAPANDIIFAVVCNTDYIYEGEQTRKAHHHYKLRALDGIKGRGHWMTRWYQWNSFLGTSSLPVCMPDEVTDYRVACDSLVWIDGNTYTSSNNTATYTLSNAGGCDSIVRLDLVINETPDPSATKFDNVILAYEVDVDFQWVDCNNGYTAIEGENDQAFRFSESGDYALIVSENECVDTSSCFTVLMDHILNYGFAENIKVYPNPSDGEFTVSLGQQYDAIEYKLINMLGEIIQSGREKNTSHFSVNLEASTGIYLLELSSREQQVVKKITLE